MNNLKTNILIGVVALVLCLIITIANGINFFLLAIPLLVIILIIYLSGLLKNRFGKTYGITWMLLLVFVIPGLWYLISANMPMTSKMIEHKKNKEDLSSFQNYSGGVDAKKEVADYQFHQDSILKEKVSLLLKDDKVDSALALIKQSEENSEKVKSQLFNQENYDSENKAPVSGKVVFVSPKERLIRFGPRDTIRTGLIIQVGDLYSFINPTAPFKVDGFSQPYYIIDKTIDFEAKKRNMIIIYGAGYSGEVVVKIN